MRNTSLLQKRIPVGILFERRGRDPASKDPLRLPGHGEGVSVRVEAAHHLEAEGHAPSTQSQGNLSKEGKYMKQKSPKKENLGTFSLLLYLSDWKTENVKDASIGEIEGFN
jgi:hypothetical protein